MALRIESSASIIVQNCSKLPSIYGSLVCWLYVFLAFWDFGTLNEQFCCYFDVIPDTFLHFHHILT